MVIASSLYNMVEEDVMDTDLGNYILYFHGL
jgi:hypothetical protein